MLKKLCLICTLFLSFFSFTQNQISNGSFEFANSFSGYSAFTDNSGSIFSCSNIQNNDWNIVDLNNIQDNNFFNPVSLVVLNSLEDFFDPILSSLSQPINLTKVNTGIRSVKINPTNPVPCGACTSGDVTSLVRVINDFYNPIDSPILSLKYALVFSMPSSSTDVLSIARFDVLDSNFNVVDSVCINSNDNIIQGPIQGNQDNFGDWRYVNWTCIDLNVCEFINSNDIGYIRITVQDFNKGFTSYMYLDDVGNNGNSCNGSVLDCSENQIQECLTKLKVDNPLLVCPTIPISITGNFKKNNNILLANLELNILNEVNEIVITSQNYFIQMVNSSSFDFTFNLNEEYFNSLSLDGIFHINVTAEFMDENNLICSLKSDTTSFENPAIVFIGCETDCLVIDNQSFGITDTGMFFWDNPNNSESFSVEFIQNSNCCGPFIPELQTSVFQTTINSFNLHSIENHLTCGTIRIRDDFCDLWSDACCLSVKPQLNGNTIFTLLRDLNGNCSTPNERSSLNEFERDIIIFHNLRNNEIYVHLKNRIILTDIMLLNLNGQLVSEFYMDLSNLDRIKINIKDQKAGLYFLGVKSINGLMFFKKIVKN